MEPSSAASDLPLGLERRIFEICALSRPVGIPKLMRVAWRVKEWVEPLLYRTITVGYTGGMKGYPIFTWEILDAAIRSKPPSFFATAVCNLNIFLPRRGHNPDPAEIMLSLCTNVHNLSLVSLDQFSSGSRLQSLVHSLPLAHLHADSRLLFHGIQLSHSVFARVTHLEVWTAPDPEAVTDTSIWAQLSLLPQLTHLSFGGDTSFIPQGLSLLETCKSLSVLISLSRPGEAVQRHLQALAQDVRFVVM
ncbi:hypothetical protein MVEN_00264900 [Mycena venus]|uniref:F-box domain-containing protein n=1 Tax=Mycena venus TaxID=2733690 RepID=A0A8H6YYG0_9AGAR|nr:hypothetical protein MVEN_00264900 [Mycena venus]